MTTRACVSGFDGGTRAPVVARDAVDVAVVDHRFAVGAFPACAAAARILQRSVVRTIQNCTL